MSNVTTVTAHAAGNPVELRSSEFQRRLRQLLAEFGASHGAIITVEEE